MSLTIEYLFVLNERGDLGSIEIRDALVVPELGDYVHVDGYRQVINIAHYYGVVVSNGWDDVNELYKQHRQHPSGSHTIVHVRLGPKQKCPRGMA
jgi:hypothetical protein